MSLEERLEQFHIELCKELKIKPTNQFEFDWGDGGLGSIEYVKTYGFIISIDVDLCEHIGTCPFIVMAHETYHLYQYRTGLLSLQDDYLSRTYKGQPMLWWTDRKPYSQWPWERAAVRYEKKIAKTKGLIHPSELYGPYQWRQAA